MTSYTIMSNTVSGSYRPVQCVNIASLELAPFFSHNIWWSPKSDLRSAGQLFAQPDSFTFSMLTATRFEESKTARATIESFEKLGDNWDGYGASSISQSARDNAIRFVNVMEAAPIAIPAPEISPKPAGTISFEWEMPHAEAYIEIGNTRYSGFIKTDQQQSVFLQGYAKIMDQQIAFLVHNALSPSPTYSSSVTEIHTQAQWYERLAA